MCADDWPESAASIFITAALEVVLAVRLAYCIVNHWFILMCSFDS